MDYVPLKISAVSRMDMDTSTISLWRMNLMATSMVNTDLVFVAHGKHIKAFNLLSHTTAILKYDDGGVINAILIGFLQNQEVVVSVDENGNVLIHYTNNLDRAPMKLDNDGQSTWGCDVHKSGLVAVSDNSRKIRIWDLIADAEHSILGDSFQRDLRGHRHNIPCVRFHPDGSQILSCSIDQKCNLWDLKTGNMLLSFAGIYWNWACEFISLHEVKFLRDDDSIWDELEQKDRPLQDFPRFEHITDTGVVGDSGSSLSADSNVGLSDEGSVQENELEISSDKGSVQKHELEISSDKDSGSRENFEQDVIDEPQDQSEDDYLNQPEGWSFQESMAIDSIIFKDPQPMLYILSDLDGLTIFDQRLRSSSGSILRNFSHLYNEIREMDRVSYFKWLPELSAAIMASPSGFLFVGRIFKSLTRVAIVFEHILECNTIISGISCVKLPTLIPTYQVRVLLRDGELEQYHITWGTLEL